MAYALMAGVELNIRAIFKSSMRKVRVHRGCVYAFGGLTTELCKHAGVLEEPLDYFPHIEAPHYNVTNIKGSDESTGHMLTIVEREHRHEHIMGRIYGLEILHHRIGGRPST